MCSMATYSHSNSPIQSPSTQDYVNDTFVTVIPSGRHHLIFCIFPLSQNTITLLLCYYYWSILIEYPQFPQHFLCCLHFGPLLSQVKVLTYQCYNKKILGGFFFAPFPLFKQKEEKGGLQQINNDSRFFGFYLSNLFRNYINLIRKQTYVLFQFLQ